MLEFARQAPDVLEVGTWLAKQLAWWRRFAADARVTTSAHCRS